MHNGIQKHDTMNSPKGMMKSGIFFAAALCMMIFFSGCSSNNNEAGGTQSNAIVTRILPQTVRAGENFTVSLTMAVNGNLNAVGLEEDYPSGWNVSKIPLKGVLNHNPDRIEWLFWSMGEPIINRTINYTITAPANYSGFASFTGKVIAKTTYKTDGDTSVNVIN